MDIGEVAMDPGVQMSLRDKLRLRMEKNYQGQYIFPPGTFDANVVPPIISEDDVEKHLMVFHKDRVDFQHLRRWVLSAAKGIFATLVLLGAEDVIDVFYDQLQSDDTLPMSEEQIESLSNKSARNNGWIRQFYEEQWCLLTPSLTNDFGHKNFPRHTRLPISRTEDSEGGAFAEDFVGYLISPKGSSDDLTVVKILPNIVTKLTNCAELHYDRFSGRQSYRISKQRSQCISTIFSPC
jgi:hypothetical protein